MVCLAFYRAKRGDWMDKVIDLFTGGVGFSHVELVFSDGASFSASPRGRGVRYLRIDYAAEAGQWEFVPIEMSPDEERAVRAFCDRQDGKGYDFWGAVCSLFHSLGEDKKRWFCTEVIISALQQVFIQSDLIAHHQHPNSYYLHSVKNGAFRRHA